jgi:prevent-host-death family protein
MEVGVRELKARLSEYLERAAHGEVVVVTERGRPKALLGPLPGRGRLEQGIAEGWVRPPLRTGALEPAPTFTARRRVLDVLAEDRDE